MKHFSVLLSVVLLFGCSAEKKLQRRIDKAKILAYQHPSEFSGVCSTLFPFKDSLGKITVKYLPADNSSYNNSIDSLNREIDVLREAVSKDKDCDKYLAHISSLQDKINTLQKRKIKPDTVYIEKPVFSENTAKLTDLKTELASTTADLNKHKENEEHYKKVAQTRLFYVISLLILFLGSVFLLFKKW